jgi:AcrR family transcriptional regulator
MAQSKTAVKERAVTAAPQRRTGARERSALATQASILNAATKVFAEHGFAGTSVDRISKAANSHDRMIYYYFGSKEQLFTAVLEDLYRRFNVAEAAIKLQDDQPVESLKTIVRFVWNYYLKNPDFITLLNTENLHKGSHLLKSGHARDCARPAIGIVNEVLKRGATAGIFRADILARDVYLMIAALGYFYLSNQHTLSATLGEKLLKPASKAHWENFILEAVLRTVSV